MSEGQENNLGAAASAYLRSARHQPIAWNEWGAEAFAKAQAENKPVLLDIGAVWCHWCHVMDRESYESAATAEIINAKFVPVKVDRDERPDVDTRYQSAVAAISGQGGWPLTAFLTPEGKPFFGGTYFPPDERYGRPSFQRVLLAMAEAFENRREEVEESAGSVMAAIEHNESFSGRASGVDRPLNAPLLDKLIESAVKQFDERNGGFGSQPKFPHPGALDLLIDQAGRGGGAGGIRTPPMDGEAVHEWGTQSSGDAERARKVATVTLSKMAAGGIYDQLAGGFHRYSVDERWIVPHFEKMAYDNSELLKNYAHAFESFGEQRFAEVAKDILRWMDEWLSDRERGGFYASQDADDSLDDDGDYFTWTRAEAAAVLTPEEFEVAAAFYNLRVVGDMHHNTQKNVLHVVTDVESIAAALKRDVEVARAELDAAKRKMYAARLRRKTPYVDKTVYTGWNGMCIAAYLAAGRALGLKEPADFALRSKDFALRAKDFALRSKDFALRSLDRVLAEAWDGDSLAHVVAYGEGVGAARIAGVLEDYGFVGNAALDAWEASGEMRYFAAAQAIADAMLAKFYDATGGGFFDTEPDATAIGALSAMRKPLQDSPTPAGNPVAATLLLRLHALTDREEYRTLAEETLETFAGVVEHFGLYASSYGLALRRAVEGPVQVCVIAAEADGGAGDALADELAAAALRPYAANKSVVRLRRSQMDALPPALAETLPHLPEGMGTVAVVCKGNACLPPVSSVEALVKALASA